LLSKTDGKKVIFDGVSLGAIDIPETRLGVRPRV
jgi:hypothetical protein